MRYDVFSIPTLSDNLNVIYAYSSPYPSSFNFFFRELKDLMLLQERVRLRRDSPLLVGGNFNIDLLKASRKQITKALSSPLVACISTVQVHTSDYGSRGSCVV